MERVTLSATARTETGKNAVKKIRKSGSVPAILYGRARDPQPLAVGRKELVAAIAAGGRNVLIDLRLSRDGGEPNTVMIAEIQRDYLRREILHVDLHQISLTERLEARVPVVLAGTPAGVASGQGILGQHLREVLVRCLPTQIPDHLTIDVAGLGVGDSLHVRDLPVPEGIEILTPPEEVLVAVGAPEAEEVEAAAAAPAEGVVEPEVVGRAATPAEGEAGAPSASRPEAKAAKAEAKPAKAETKPAKPEAKPAKPEKKE
jgi:large subunit ribosomal protein L25